MTIEKLYKTLDQRKRPEDVAEMILELVGDRFTLREKVILEKAAKGSLKRSLYHYTSMSQVFGFAVGADRQIEKAIEIFELEVENEIDGHDAKAVENFIKKVSGIIHKDFGKNHFVHDRLSKAERKELGLDISKRNYNKKWRLLKRLEKKLESYKRVCKKIEFQKVGKHGICHHLSFKEFSKDLNTACFIAYYNARSNLRSIFTNQSQVRAFDEISKMLLDRCCPKPSYFFRFNRSNEKLNTNWWAIAHVYTDEKILARLTDTQKGKLLGSWTSILEEIALFLGELWQENNINRETMIVRRGNDSSTWNNTAAAWNKARDNWMNLIYALGMDYTLDEICFGKVMRLMAGDVAAWHRSSGGGLEPNTLVWNKLPLPWEVFQGKKKCNKVMVVEVCKSVGLNAEKSGWIAPRKHKVATFTPTPELVHGVQISNPYLATILKKHRFFSGKKGKSIIADYN